jgi:amino acid transporter
MTAFLGMELAAVHIQSIENPQRNFPRAIFFSVIIILFTMICGSLAIALVLPQGGIRLVDGVMQTFKYFFHEYHADFLLPIIVVLLLIGSIGGMVNWIISPAKGLLMASKHGFLPAWLTVVNKKNVPYRILIAQACLVTLLGTAFLALPNVNSIYWLFTDLSTELYIVMYALMFIAAIKLKMAFPEKKRPFKVPFGKFGYYTTCLLGLTGCVITLVIGFFPPEESIQMSGEMYRQLFTKGIISMLLPAFLLYFYKRSKLENLN